MAEKSSTAELKALKISEGNKNISKETRMKGRNLTAI